MSFQVTVAGIDELSTFQMTTDVSLDRRIYEHSRARIVFHWDEDGRYSERQTASLAAKVLNCTVDVVWKAFDTSETTPCFHGYVDQVFGDREGGKSRLILGCVSFSMRADLAPRFRAFQACKLLDICQQVAKSEPLIKIDQSADLNFDIPLSVQYAETDYAYLSRMMHAWGVPMSVSDKTGEVTLGARGVAAAAEFPDLDFRWTQISFSGSSGYYPKRQNSGSGPSNAARGQVDQLNSQVADTATAYDFIPDTQPIKERHSTAHSQSDTASYTVTFHGGLLPFAPGEVVSFEGQDHIIRAIRVTGDPRVATATQELELQSFTLPYQPELLAPTWLSRALWAWVVDNEKDPAQRGRIQVTFDLESLDPQSGGDKVWLHTVTPYGGGKSPSQGKAGEYNGFYSLPEIGERVLVEFLGEWDSEAVVLGTVRDQSVSPMFDSKETKRWRLPSGTEVAMTSNDSVDIVRLRAKDKIFFEAKMGSSGPEFTITPGESDDDLIHFKTGELYVKCSGAITMVGQGALHLEGTQVQIKASGGNVNVDGAPNVMINCMPMPAMPLQVQKFTEKMGSVSPENRVLPSPILGTAATGGDSGSGSGSDAGDDSQTPDTPVTWIEIVLKDKQGVPIPNERYRIKLADGTTQEGSLDGDGKARVDGIKPGTAQVSFPDRDGNEWKPA
jgi:phage baseplate assembly protein gpV